MGKHIIYIFQLVMLIDNSAGLYVFMYLLSSHFISEAVVGLEKTIYRVSEYVGVLEVCAIVYSPTVDCPIVFPFDVSLSTSDNTAGISC